MSGTLLICALCGGDCEPEFSLRVRAKWTASLNRCARCHFRFFDKPEWLEEAYAVPINVSDTGYVSRNLAAAEFITRTLAGSPEASFYCDYGAGYGLLVRLMRDRGFRFHWHDVFTQNLFAPYTEASTTLFRRYELVTACEVFEHLPDPVGGLREMLNFSDTIVFTTELLPSDEDIRNWPYLGLYHGQHVSFYTEAGLQALASRFDKRYVRIASNWHLIGPDTKCSEISEGIANASTKPRTLPEKIANRFGYIPLPGGESRRSLLMEDHEKIVQHLSSPNSGQSFHLDIAFADSLVQ